VIVGRSYPPGPPYLVGREKVREFAAAIGERSPLSSDVAAAQAAGHADLVAPPTFGIVFALPACEPAVTDPDVAVDYARVVHADQAFAYVRPIVAGDLLSTSVEITGHKVFAGNVVLTITATVTDADAAPVVTVTTTLVSRAEES
jgi:acyl dehydratase